MIGSRLGQYEVLERLGAGGMGEVFRARDTRLGRDVALKMVPPQLVHDEGHRIRLEREARLLASLNHPHIAAIYGLEEHEGRHFLVLELVPGADLAKRLARGPIPVDEVLGLARQVADALDSAHRQGVIHRDLKPANIAQGRDGAVKVLDFGLAKALEQDEALAADPALSPTLPGAATGSHVILGTPAYMSPEQARGTDIDARADVWAFGCVLYECLTGHRAFAGGSTSETIAAVLRDPVDFDRLPAGTPPALRRLLRRCLERDPARRLHSVADARLDLDDAMDELRTGSVTAAPAPAAVTPAGRILRWAPWALAGVLAVTLLVRMPRGAAPPPPERAMRFAVMPDSLEGARLYTAVISPDGSRVVFAAGGRLWIRELNSLVPSPVAGTEDAVCVFWSPDGREIGFQAHDRLWRLSVDGGRPVPICSTTEEFSEAGGAAWGDDGTIVFASGNGAIYRVPAAGGEASVLLDMDPARDDDFHEPSLLPGNRGVLFVTHTLRSGRPHVERFRDGVRDTVLTVPGAADLGHPIYSGGYLLFTRERPDAGIWAVRFPLDRLRAEGEPFLVAAQGSAPSVARDGTLVYGEVWGDHRLVRVDRDGSVRGAPVLHGGHLDDAALSASGRRLLIASLEGEQYTVMVHDLVRDTRVEIDRGVEVMNPFWLGETTVGIVHADSSQLVARELDTTSPPRVLFRGAGRGTMQRMGASPWLTFDGSSVLFTLSTPEAKSNIWIVPADGSRDGRPLLESPVTEENPVPSPVAPLFAYESDASGRTEVYLARLDFPEGGVPSRRWQVSSGGGLHARWSSDGTRLFYKADRFLMEVEVTATPSVELSRPRPLLDLDRLNLEPQHGYCVDRRDGTFLLVQAGDPETTHRCFVLARGWQPTRE